MTDKVGICTLCGKPYHNWGNNAQPLDEGRCCDECNAAKVIPARIDRLMGRGKNGNAEGQGSKS